MRILKVLAFLALAIGGWITYQLLIAYPDVTVRYRIEANFEYQGKPVSASSIWEVEYQSHNSHQGALKGLTTYTTGEAPTATLSDDSRLFLRVDAPELSRGKMTQWNYPDRILLRLLQLERVDPVETVKSIAKAAEEGRTFRFGLDLLPRVLILRTPDEPESFYEPEICDPGKKCDLTFVEGLVTFVNEPPTYTILQIYPWLPALEVPPMGAPRTPGKTYPALPMFTRRMP